MNFIFRLDVPQISHYAYTNISKSETFWPQPFQVRDFHFTSSSLTKISPLLALMMGLQICLLVCFCKTSPIGPPLLFSGIHTTPGWPWAEVMHKTLNAHLQVAVKRLGHHFHPKQRKFKVLGLEVITIHHSLTQISLEKWIVHTIWAWFLPCGREIKN